MTPPSLAIVDIESNLFELKSKKKGQSSRSVRRYRAVVSIDGQHVVSTAWIKPTSATATAQKKARLEALDQGAHLAVAKVQAGRCEGWRPGVDRVS